MAQASSLCHFSRQTEARIGLVRGLSRGQPDDRAQGFQEGRFFKRTLRELLPLDTLCNGQLLVSYPRPGNIDGAVTPG